MRVVITLPAYRAEGALEKTFADIPAGVAFVAARPEPTLSTIVDERGSTPGEG